MRKLLFLIIAVFHSLWLGAVPARPVPLTVTQSDGTVLTVLLFGDETFHYATTADGVPIVQTDGGSYRYMQADGGRLVGTAMLAHNAEVRTVSEATFAEACKSGVADVIEASARKALLRKRQQTEGLNSQRRSPIVRKVAYCGRRKGLVILIDFSDLHMASTTAQRDFNRQFNEEGYSDNGHVGSVHDFFYDQSYGTFDLTFDVVGPVVVGKSYAYYGENDGNGDDSHVGEMVAEACNLVDSQVNFADYDWDGDGEVEQVFFVYAGYAESSGADANTIWPHKSSLYNQWKYYGSGEGPLTLDGVKIDTYACSSELEGTRGTAMRGIGTACHEFSHCLGLPDAYDVNYGGGIGMQNWDLMSSGNYNGPSRNGERPVGYNAYERSQLGWLTLTELDAICRITDMPDLDTAPVAYALYNDNCRDEFFVLENRQRGKWFAYIDSKDKSHGMLVTHIDYSEKAWQNNSVNTMQKHQRFSFIPADNSYGRLMQSSSGRYFYDLTDDELTGDLFPGRLNVTELTDNSHSAVGATLFNASADGSYCLHKPLTNIKEHDGLVGFDLLGGLYVPVPTDLKAEQEGSDGVTLSWTLDQTVDSCVVELSEVRLSPFFNRRVSEDFNKFTTAEGTDDGTFDVSRILALYTSTTGWRGSKLFTSAHGAKIEEGGYVQTPQFSIANDGVTISLKAETPGKDVPSIACSLIDNEGRVVAPLTFDGTTADGLSASLDDLPAASYCLRIDAAAMSYLSALTVYDGRFTSDELSNPFGGTVVTPTDARHATVVGETFCRFSGLKAQKYRCRVKAMKDEASSNWTSYGKIKLQSRPDGICAPSAGGASLAIYGTDGVRHNSSSTLHRGIVLLRKDKHVKKIVVK